MSYDVKYIGMDVHRNAGFFTAHWGCSPASLDRARFALSATIPYHQVVSRYFLHFFGLRCVRNSLRWKDACLTLPMTRL